VGPVGIEPGWACAIGEESDKLNLGGVMILLLQFKCMNPKHHYSRNVIRGVSLLFLFLLVLNAFSWANAQDGLDLYISNSC